MPTQRTIPRARGYDKRSIAKHAKALQGFGGTLQQYARKHGLEANSLVVALQDGFPEQWQNYVAKNGTLQESTCPYCQKTFVPNNANHMFCERRCSRDAQTDLNYFGGKRRETIGLREGICQLCGQSPKKGLTPHHLIGAENDPENRWLLALCVGCHQLVTLASRRKFLQHPSGWRRLMRLVELRVAGVLDGEEFTW